MTTSDHLKKDIERHHEKEKSKKESKAKPKREVHHFEVTPAADNSGYSVETHYKRSAEPMGKGGATMDDYENRREMTVHKDSKSVKNHIDACCGDGEQDD